MHPRQRPLPSEIEEVWLAALGDAGFNPDEALLYMVEGEQGSNGYAARYLHRHRELQPEGEPEEVHPLLDEMNSDECIDAHRVVVFRERGIEGVAALIRHELEHARQHDCYGQRLTELHGLAEHVISERVGGLAGGGFLYQVIPDEMDANAASSAFVRGRYGAAHIDGLLRAGDKDGAAFRSLIGPAPLDTLPERMVRFFSTMPDLCDRLAARNDDQFARLLDLHWRGVGDVYERLLNHDELRLPR